MHLHATSPLPVNTAESKLFLPSTNMETLNRAGGRDKVTNAAEGFALTLEYLQFYMVKQ